MHNHPDLRDTLQMLRNENASLRLIGVFMEDAIWRRHGSARLPLREIAWGTGLHEDTTYRAVNRLIRLGFIQRLRVGGRSNGSVYRLLG